MSKIDLKINVSPNKRLSELARKQTTFKVHDDSNLRSNMVRFQAEFSAQKEMRPFMKYEYNEQGNMQNNLRTKKDPSVAKYIDEANQSL